ASRNVLGAAVSPWMRLNSSSSASKRARSSTTAGSMRSPRAALPATQPRVLAGAYASSVDPRRCGVVREDEFQRLDHVLGHGLDRGIEGVARGDDAFVALDRAAAAIRPDRPRQRVQPRLPPSRAPVGLAAIVHADLQEP